ncbi:hypothetical protein KAR91_22485 [Candidatus Pacearchaeota archaeon]|nr:hypothetical protein [Candidatus Pacearchaeota archaeon]
MKKPWYTAGCATQDKFMESHNLFRVHEMFFLLGMNLGLDFDPNHVFKMKEVLKNEVIDWYAENDR